eukprot:155112_1
MGCCNCCEGSEYLRTQNNEDKYTKFQLHEQLDLIAFDFDQTITKLHLYFVLNGTDANEQLVALENTISEQRLIEIFGGEDRIQRLQTHFKLLSTKIKYIAIISFGFEKVIRRALELVNLLQYFTDDLIIGNDTNLLQDVSRNKGMCLKGIIDKYELNKNNVLFVDDDKINIILVNNYYIADTLWISSRNGISYDEMKIIEKRISVYDEQNDNDNDSNKGSEENIVQDENLDMMDNIIKEIKDEQTNKC